MVFFTCDGCGESLKKNQVEKHTFACRKSHALSCMDCNKVFHAEEYKSHTKCISEDQKYAAKGYTPKENKGEIKQQIWIKNVREAIGSVDPKNRRLREMLERIEEYPNIPRKEQKFLNFLSNSLNCRDKTLANDVWVAISSTAKVMEERQNEEKAKNEEKTPKTTPKSAKKLKETTPKTPKRKAVESPAEAAESATKKSRKVSGTEEALEDGGTQENGGEAGGSFIFKWASVIKRFLKNSPQKTMKIKKLQKQVVGEFTSLAAQEESAVDETKAERTFREKLEGMKKVTVDGKIVKYEG